MKILEVIEALQESVPSLHDSFSDTLGVSSLSQSAGVATLITTTAHGRNIGDDIVVTGAKTAVVITSLTQTDGVATATTATPHDLTEEDGATVNISGVTETEYNGEHELLTVNTLTTFTFAVDSGATSPATGSPVLLEDLSFGYNGKFAVVSVPSTTELTYELPSNTLPSPAQGDMSVETNFRISGAGSPQEAVELYKQHTQGSADPTKDSWMIASFGREISYTDTTVRAAAPYNFATGQDYRQKITQEFSVYVFVPRTQSFTARDIRDSMEAIRNILIGSICGVEFGTGLDEASGYLAVFAGDNLMTMDKATYVHSFDFAFTYDIGLTDTAISKQSKSVAFRKASFILSPSTGDEEFTLTDVPL